MTTVKCMYYPDLSNTSRRQLEARISVLDRWPLDLNDALQGDPRCGCGAPDSICEWDDARHLEGLL